MKKCISLLLTALLLFAVMLPAGATTILPPLFPIADKNGYTFTVNETEEGPVLCDVVFVGTYVYPFSSMAEEAYIPKTLGGVPVTTENFGGAVFSGSPEILAFSVDDDNAQFSVKDGLLFTKDGKTLIAVPNLLVKGIVRIPDGTEKLGPCSVLIKNPPVEDEKSVCIVIPASVTEIDANFADGKAPVLAGYADSAAQSFAEENGLTFVLLGEGHTHSYFRCVTEATCLHGGETTVTCPCGNCIFSEQTKPLSHNWRTRETEKEDGKRYLETYCTSCGTVKYSRLADTEDGPACSCRCHKINRTWSISLTKDNWQEVFRNAIFRIKLAFWRLSGTHLYCECGARHY